MYAFGGVVYFWRGLVVLVILEIGSLSTMCDVCHEIGDVRHSAVCFTWQCASLSNLF